MGFVLVPVPTEYVLHVMRWVLFRADDGNPEIAQQDAERVAALLAETDDDTRWLLQLVAAATLHDEPLRLRDLADELGQESTAVSAAIDALNRDTLADGRLLIDRSAEVAVGVQGQTGRIVFVSMRLDLAKVIRAAARHDRAR